MAIMGSKKKSAAAKAIVHKKPSKPAAKCASVMKRPASKKAIKKAKGSGDKDTPSSQFSLLLDTHLIESMYKQCHLEDIVKGDPWSMSQEDGPGKGKLCFGGRLAFDCQIIGTEAEGVFLWAWANPSVPEDMARAAAGLRERHADVPEFAEPRVPLSVATGRQLAAVACGLLGAGACYCGPTPGGGAAFFVVADPALPGREPETAGDAARLMRVIGQALQLSWVTNPAAAVDAFLRRHGAKPKSGMSYRLPGDQGVVFALEANSRGRITKMSTTVGPLSAK